jgi:pimeloyl-ACP methyl ester carboxylesterase
MLPRRVWWAIATVVIAAAAVAILVAPYARSAAFIADLAGVSGWWRPLLLNRTSRVAVQDLSIPTRRGTVDARLYEPDAAPLGSLIVFPGIHAGGVDEPRLTMFAKRLAASGARVVTVPLPDLRVYRITPGSTDVIEDSVDWMTSQPRLAPERRVGVVGVSFAGGLALVAAGRPSLRNKVTLVVSLGGHADLPRVMSYLCTGVLPDGTRRPPHDYGVVVVLLASLPKIVPAPQVPALDRAILTFLDASSAAEREPERATLLLGETRRQADTLPEPARTIMTEVMARDARAVGARILPFVEELGGAPALSPVRSPPTRAPVFLLHGLDDNVIPSSETPFAAAYLESHGNVRVRWLLTPLLTHADLAASPSFVDTWRLVQFWTRMLQMN